MNSPRFLKREKYLQDIIAQFRVHPICAILGPRQVGKTTLAHLFVEQHFAGDAYFFDLENKEDLARLDNPMLAFRSISQTLIVIDEIQLRPELFPTLRVFVDEFRIPLGIHGPSDTIQKKQFLILGSASRDLIRQSSETLAGRIGYIELPPFSLAEVHNTERLWMRGGFPHAYLAETEDDSYLWRQDYIKTFLERDIPSLGFDVPAAQMKRFWLMLTHYHGQIFNASEIGRSMGISDHMVRKHLDILAGTFMVRVLLPWFENLSKRQVRAPKLYFRDSGILHALTEITDCDRLYRNPKLGAFWEGFALQDADASQVVVAGKAVRSQRDHLGVHRRGLFVPCMTHVKETEPIVRRPVVRAHRNGLLEGLFGGVELVELLVHIAETAVRGIVGRLQVEPSPVFGQCLIVAACATKCPAETDVRRRQRGVTLCAPLATFYRCVRPLVLMRQSVFAPVGFSQSRVGSRKRRILL